MKTLKLNVRYFHVKKKIFKTICKYYLAFHLRRDVSVCVCLKIIPAYVEFK